MSKLIISCIASAAVGAWIGWTLHGSNSPMQAIDANPSVVRPIATPDDPSVASIGIDAALLRAVVREELAAANANGRQSPAAPSAINEPAASSELVAQRRAAVQEIETMVRSGEWGNEQRSDFHERMALLDSEQGARVLREVTTALNNGALHVTTNGPPL